MLVWVAIAFVAGIALEGAGAPRLRDVALAQQDFDSGNFELTWAAYGDDNEEFHLPHGADTSSVVRYQSTFIDGIGTDDVEDQLPEGWEIPDIPCAISVFNQWHIESSPASIPWLATLVGALPDPELSPEPVFSIPPVFWYGTTPLADPEADPPPPDGPIPPCNRLVGAFFPPKYPMGDLCTEDGEGLLPTCGSVVSPRINLYDVPTPIVLTFANLMDKIPGLHVARVEISVNGSEFAILQDYTAIAGLGLGTRSSFPFVYPKEELDISDFAYSTVQFRFFFVNFNPFLSTNFYGWVIDNIEVRGGMGTRRPPIGLPPGPPPLLPPLPLDPLKEHLDFRCLGEVLLPTGIEPPLEQPRVFVADTGNHRISVFRYDHDQDTPVPEPCILDQGPPERNWFGSYGDDDSHLNSPYDVVVGPDGYIYVADTGNHRIMRFKQSGKPAPHGGSHGGGADNAYGNYGDGKGDGGMPQFNSPKGIAAGGWNYLPNPGGLVPFIVEHFYLYVADTGNHRVQRLAINKSGQLVNSAWMEWGAYGDGDEQFHLPTGIDVNPIHTPTVILPPIFQLPTFPEGWESRVYVADRGNHRVMVTDHDGAFKNDERWGKYGDEFDIGEPYLTELNSPEDVAVGVRFEEPDPAAQPSVDVYTADTGNHRIFYGFYEPMTDYRIGTLHAFGRYGDDDGLFNSPTGLAVDRLQPEDDGLGGFGTGGDSVGVDGDPFVIDTGNHRGQRFGRPQ